MQTLPDLRRRALAALRTAQGGRGAPDGAGYVADWRDLLLPGVEAQDFAADLDQGAGHELGGKFRAVHSSTGLAVNGFAPFRRRLADLILPGGDGWQDLRFEAKLPTGLRRGTPPNLDLLVTGTGGVVGIESKLTEWMTPKRAAFSSAYADEITDWRRDEGWFAQMAHLVRSPGIYRHLDAAQLVKHAFALGRLRPAGGVTLLYLYWEPANADSLPACATHRAEIAALSAAVAGSVPAFVARSHDDLWASWAGPRAPAWRAAHVAALRRRYHVAV